MNYLKQFEENQDLIIEETLNLLPTALSGDRANRSFYFREGKVDYSYYLGEIILDDSYFFSVLDHQTVDAGDFGYESESDMLNDIKFIDDYYRQAIESSIESHILKLSCRV